MPVGRHAHKKLQSIGSGGGGGIGDDSDALPASIEELSRTFGAAMQHFHTVTTAKRPRHPLTPSSSPQSQQQQQSTGGADDEPWPGFFLERIVPSVVDAAHLKTTDEEDEERLRALHERKRQRDIVAARTLYSADDVLAAISYVTSAHARVVTAADKGEPWATDAAVAPAMRNLSVWALAAEQFLAEAQTQQLLANIALCTSHSFVQINDIPGATAPLDE
jgi:hypothetical protein